MNTLQNAKFNIFMQLKRFNSHLTQHFCKTPNGSY